MRQARSMRYIDPTGRITSDRNADSFVDGTRKGFNDEKKHQWISSQLDIITMLNMLRECAQLWENLLFSSVGASEISKCYYQMMHWHWDQLGYPRLTVLKQSKLDPTPEEYEVGQKQKYAMKIFSERDTERRDASQAHHLIWAAQMMYSIPVMSMTQTQLEGIQNKERRASLGKMGFSQNFPKAVVYGPLTTGGLKMVDLTSEQGICLTENFLYHKYAQDEVEKLMDMSLRISQLESGRTENILSIGKVAIPYLTDTWLMNMRIVLGKHNFQIEISNAWSPGLQCCRDSMIMQILAERRLSKHRLFHLNTCRM